MDVEGFGDLRRTNPDQLTVRDGLYRSLQHAFGVAGISWEACDREDRGDGVLILAPPEVVKAPFVESLPGALAEALRTHNEARPLRQRIRLRMALHAGEVRYDDHGVTGASVNLAFRLLDAPAVKAALAGSPGVLALIVSSWFFDEVVRHSPLASPATYWPVSVAVKETRTAAWICLPDHPYPQDRATFDVALDGPPPARPGDLPGRVADQLAAAVGGQWHAEAAIRRLNDPYPLPVRWVAADPALVDDWQTLVTLAASGAGWPQRPVSHARVAGPGDLAGEGPELVHVLARVPTGRLIVLGEPGAGKTVLMVRLVLDLLARRASGDPVPVLVSAASWDPVGQDLRGWLEGRLSTDYPWLAAPAAPGGARATRIRALLDRRLIMPILDGLDEIPAAARGPAIAKINDAIRPGERLVVTSRTAQWRQAVRPSGGTEVRLRAAAGISLCPLDAGVVARYLRADAGGPAAAARWDPVLAALETQPLLARVLSSPLMIGLARIIYNPRPGEHPAVLPDPAGLCANPAVEAHLLDAFIPAAYRTGRHGRLGRRSASPRQARKWLAFLARHLEHSAKTPDLAWWQLARSQPRFWPSVLVLPFGMLFGQILAVLLGIPDAAKGAGWAGSAVGFLWYGMLFGDRQPSYGFSWSALLRRVGVGNLVVLAVLAAALAAVLAFVHAGLPKVMLWIVLSSFIQAMVTASLKGGAPGNLMAAPSPKAVLIRDRRTALAVMLSAMSLGALLITVRVNHRSELVYVIAGVLVGGFVGLGVGAGASGLISAWPRWVHARVWLALSWRLPWRLMAFLADAHERGVLRQDGAVYQFRHLELQHRLTSRPPSRLASVAGKLATAVQGQWEAEAKVRGIGDQHMLPVRWRPADPSLADGWDDLVTVATSGTGWPPPRAADAWADGPHELAGEGNRLAEVLDRVPTGRLVVLGEPGAGKTTLMIALVLALLARRASADPVPVLFPAAVWDPARQDLREWLTSQLILGYPALARSAPPGAEGPTRAAALLGDGLIMPILDGLDEISAAARELAITKINEGIRPGQRLVVTSRTEPWRHMIQLPGGTGARLSAAAVQLCPLDTDVVVEHLRTDAGGQDGAARWEPVIAALDSPGPLRLALSSPLLAGLARIVYNASDSANAASPGPGELCALTDLAAIKNHLLDSFISAAYRPRPGRRARHSRRAEGPAGRWLIFLAHHLEHTIGSPGLAWWQLSNAASRRPLAGVFGFTGGLALGLDVGLAHGPLWGLSAALLATTAGTFAGTFVGKFAGTEIKEIKQPPSSWWRYRSSPRTTLRETRVAALAVAAVIAGYSAFAGGLVYLWMGDSLGEIGKSLRRPAGVLAGLLALGLMYYHYCRSPATAAWPQWLMGRAWLARRRVLPWRLIAFLADAHQRGVLTQTGAIYQFRHIELQHRLANRMPPLTALRSPRRPPRMRASAPRRHAYLRPWV